MLEAVGRWVVRRKVALLKKIDAGEVTEAEACEKYGLSAEELQSWRDSFAACGVHGLKATRTQETRAVVIQSRQQGKSAAFEAALRAVEQMGAGHA